MSTVGNYQRGRTPLHIAAGSNSKECLELFLSHGADKDMKDKVSYCNHNIIIKVVYLLNSP